MKSLASQRCVWGRDVSAEDDLAMKDALDSSSLRAVLVAAVYLASSVRSVRSQALQETRGMCGSERRETVVPYYAFGCLLGWRSRGAEERRQRTNITKKHRTTASR